MPDTLTSQYRRRTMADGLRSLQFNLSMLALLIILLAGFSLPFMVREVPAGMVGVLWKRFDGGTQTDRVLHEGIQIILPWDRFILYSARLQELKQSYDTLSSDGLAMMVEVSTRYRIDSDKVGYLHKYIGPDYASVLVGPSIGAVTRQVISQFTPEQLYSENREGIQNKLIKQFSEEISQANLDNFGVSENDLIIVTDILIRAVRLPESVNRAIERKAEQHQLMLEYQFRLAREEFEKQRRETEAQGLKAYADAMPNGILPSYLVLRGIEATLDLAKSPNSKIVMFGSQNNELPFVLNSLLNETQAGPTAAKAAAAATAAGAPAAPGTVAKVPSQDETAQQIVKLLQRMNPLPPKKAGDPAVPVPDDAPTTQSTPHDPLPDIAAPIPGGIVSPSTVPPTGDSSLVKP